MTVVSKGHNKNSSKTPDKEKLKKQEIIKSLIKSMPEEMKMKFGSKHSYLHNQHFQKSSKH